MTGQIHSMLLVAVIAAVTMAIRFAPFVLFRRNTPQAVLYLGTVLPYAIIGMLVVYCLKGVTPFAGSHGLPELIAMVTVVALHKWKHNTLLSILAGTLLYMVLLQVVFV